MAKAGDVRVDFTARDRTATAFTSLQRRLGTTERGFTKLAGSLAALTAGVGLTQFTRSTIESGSQLLYLSRRLRVGIEDLSAFEIAATRSGVSVQTLGTTMQRLQRRVDEAAQGIGGAGLQNAFRNLGLDVDKLIRLNTADQFLEIARAVRRAGDDTASLGRIVDSEGIPALRQMAEELVGLDGKAKQFANTASAEAVIGVEALGTAIATAGIEIRNFAIDVLGTATNSVRGFFRILGGGLAGGQGGLQNIEEANEKIKELQTQLDAAGIKFSSLAAQGKFDQQFIDARLEAERLNDELKRTIALRDSFQRDLDRERAKEEEAVRARLEAAAKAETERLRIIQEAADKEQRIRLTAAGKTFDDLERLTLSSQDKLIADFERNITKAEQAFIAAGGKISVGQLNALTDALSEKLRQDLEALADQGTETAQQLTVDFRGFFVSVEDGISSLREQFARFLLDLANKAINTQLGSLFAQVPFFSGLKSLFGFAQGGSFTVPPGGPLSGPDSQVVAFRAKPGERVDVTPTGRGGGGGVVLSTNIDARGASLELAARLPEILERNNRQLILEVERRRLVGVRS